VSEVLVLSGRVDELQRNLEPHLPADVHLHCFAAPEAVSEVALNAEIAVGAPDVLAPLVEHMPRLRWVQSTWAGVTPFIRAPRRDYLLTGLKGVFGRSMSEYVLAWMLALERSVLLHATRKRWQWERERGLGSLRLGIAGTGDIGCEVARRCAPFVAEVIGLNSDGRRLDEFAACYPSRGTGPREFAAQLDALVMILPDTPATDKLVGEAMLAAMNPGSLLINVGRGNALDLEAALAARRRGHLAALVLDVLEREPLDDDEPLWQEPGVYITSHTAAPTELEAIVAVFLDNLRRFQSGDALRGRVDFQRGY
jgi:phosphoglycerate dehydrogenase-like enzyme